MTFYEIYDALQDLYIENAITKKRDEIDEEIMKFIKDNGWECTDWAKTAENWIKEHPECDENDFEESDVCHLEFLCENDFIGFDGHDVDWHNFDVSFFGEWGRCGIFCLSH